MNRSVLVSISACVLALAFLFWELNHEREARVRDVQTLASETKTLTEAIAALQRENTTLIDLLSLESQGRAELEALQAESASILQELTASQIDSAALVLAWAPYVYGIECTFDIVDPDGTDHTSRGSAILERDSTGNVRFITNRHVLEEDGLLPRTCDVTHPDLSEDFDVLGDDAVLNPDIDFGYILTTDPEVLVRPTLSFARRCTETPNIGDPVVLLGYPGIGAHESITATEGIISGFDEDNYLTSGKIDTGSSGGAAIHAQQNCLLGMPTIVFRGVLESLARILPLNNL